jgi:hypothetical protein
MDTTSNARPTDIAAGKSELSQAPWTRHESVKIRQFAMRSSANTLQSCSCLEDSRSPAA